MSSGKVLLGVLAGLAAGALIGILFAPAKGSVTRKEIAKQADEYADALKEKFNEFLAAMNEKIETVKEEFEKPDSEEVKKDVKSAKA